MIYAAGQMRAQRRKNRRWVRKMKQKARNAGKAGKLARLSLELLRDTKRIYAEVEMSNGVLRVAGLR